MTVLAAIAVAFSMFSAIPMPRVDWNEQNMRYSLCAFPLVGLAIALFCRGWLLICGCLQLPDVLRGAGMCIIPILVTGGIHLDGFADTSDALASHAEPEKKQQILKDPHLGAFAVIRLCAWMIADFALWSAIPSVPVGLLALMFCLSRVLSALAVASFPLARNTGLVHTFAAAADKQRVRAFMIVLTAALAVGMALYGVRGILMAASALLVFAMFRPMAVRQFGGLSGDLSGWFLQMAEIAMPAALCLSSYVLEVIA